MLSEVVTCNCVRNPGGHTESNPRPSEEGASFYHVQLLSHNLAIPGSQVGQLQLASLEAVGIRSLSCHQASLPDNFFGDHPPVDPSIHIFSSAVVHHRVLHTAGAQVDTYISRM